MLVLEISIENANEYIETQIIDIEDWQEAEEEKKKRILNAAKRTLNTKFKEYDVPSEAIYVFAAWLAIAFNDTNKLQKHGIAGFSVTGVASFTFKESLVDGKGTSLLSLVPDEVYQLIGEANGVDLAKRRVGRSVR